MQSADEDFDTIIERDWNHYNMPILQPDQISSKKCDGAEPERASGESHVPGPPALLCQDIQGGDRTCDSAPSALHDSDRSRDIPRTTSIEPEAR